MPQLAIETFPSQIFWILLGFLLVYIFVSKVITPSIEETLENRYSHIDDIVKAANQLRSEAEKLKKETFASLENAELDSIAAESKLIISFREQSLEEKNALHELFSKKSKMEYNLISKSVDEAFKKISKDLDSILDLSMKSISCTMKGKK